MRHKSRLAEPADVLGHWSSKDGRATRSSGFSLIELLVVVAICLVVTDFAIPSITTTVDTFRIRGTVTSATGLIQRARVQAIKRSFTQRVHFATVNNNVVLF